MTTTAKTDNKKEIENELKIYQIIKPYIGHCLTLNHDINNPLAGVIGYSEFLLSEEDSLSKEQKGYLNHILTCAERIKSLVDNLCEEKIALEEKVDLRSITDSYKKVAKKLD